MTASGVARAWIQDAGVVSALGSGMEALRAALGDSRPQSLTVNSHFSPEPLPLGLVTASLPALQEWPLEFRTRCNAIVMECFRQIEPAVRAAISTYGAGRVAVVLGTSTSGIGEAQQAFARREAEGILPADFCLEQQGLGGPAEFLGRLSGARGPCFSISTACTSAAKSMASAARMLGAGVADAVIAGGVDALNRFTVAGFASLECVSSSPCNSLSVNRNGINIGEGAGLFLLSREQSPVALTGWGESSDAHHFSSPDPKGVGAMQAMRQALAMAGLAPEAIDYVNLHGTATVQNDAMESQAVHALFGADTPCSSTKTITGHALGAAGAIEAAICWQMLLDHASGRLPPHWWDGCQDPQLPELALVPAGARAARPLRRALSNSFAFGGSNAVLVLERMNAI